MDLIGRETETSHLADRVMNRRLVTVIGPGGIGKTSLAQVVVADVSNRFSLGVRTIDLTTVHSPNDVRNSVTGQLGFPSFAALVASPFDRPVLIFIDNCEHVVDTAASVIQEILDSCDTVTILATSRSPLDLPGESLVVVGPLEVPQPGSDELNVAAVRLFLRAADDIDNPIAEADLPLVGELCRRLDGVPLAVELAAARTRSMSLSEMIERFDEHLAILSRPRFRGTPRHKSLLSTIEWSYALLEPEAQRVFDQLGVFNGLFTAEMAHAVAASSDESFDQTRSNLELLIDSSMLTANSHGPTTWYRMLVSLRSFALEQLSTKGELDATRDRQAEHAWSVAKDLRERSQASWPTELLLGILVYYESVSSACRWCLKNDQDGSRALTLVAVMWGVIHQSHTSEVESLGRQVLDRWPDRSPPDWYQAAATVATAEYILGRYPEAEQRATEIKENCAETDMAYVMACRVLGQVNQVRGDTVAARDLFSEAVRAGHESGFHALAMESEVFSWALAADQGRVEEAREQLRAVADRARKAGSDINWSWAETTDAYVQLRQSPESAIKSAQKCLADAKALGYPAGISLNLRNLAVGHILNGDLTTAITATSELVNEAATRAAQDDIHSAMSVTSVLLSQAASQTDDAEFATVLVEASATLSASISQMPVVSLLSSVGSELIKPPAPGNTRLPANKAVALARTLLARLVEGNARPAPEPTDSQPLQPNRFAQSGDLWELRFAEQSAFVKNSKGMADLARLLEQPGTEIHCLDLAGAAVTESATSEVIDRQARQQYEDRIRELQEEIEEAESNHDSGRADLATAELDQILDHLSKAMGLSGKTRRSTDTAERARSAVTQRIRLSINRIEKVIEPLGRHLGSSVSTGIYCVYEPEHPTSWQVR